jgi:hypothetical protein
MAMEHTDLMEDCTSITCSDFTGVWLPVAAIYGLVLAVGIVRRVAKRRARVLPGLSARGRARSPLSRERMGT